MRIIPVMDLKCGSVVHAIGGRREEYRPIQSQLVDSAEPEAVARAFRDQLVLFDLYVADLDAIGGTEPAHESYASLTKLGLRLMIDAGVRDIHRAVSVRAAVACDIVVGLESICGPGELARIVGKLGPACVWFSLDLRDSKPICNPIDWPEAEPAAIAELAIRAGVMQFIVLDLARVGGSDGTHTEGLCGELHKRHPRVQLLAGGGVRDANDLCRLEQIGVSGALVATALHDGRLTPRDW
jgi:phosphoribosylformimino-5-aminoimidazole carboxamide ribotide isomerase